MSFNGAAVFRPRKRGHRASESDADYGFNGAAVFRPRKPNNPHPCARQHQALQRSRGLSTAETAWKLTAALPPLVDSFNGAAVFRPRKLLATTYFGTILRPASTEPRSFDRGNWGAGAWADTTGRCASTEPRSFDRGNPDRCGEGHRPRGASTEPRSFDRGNVKIVLALVPSALMLQRSRGLSTAETMVEISGRSSTMRGFNGAAVFRPRKHGRGPRGRWPGRPRFNGAAVFRPRKLTNGDNIKLPIDGLQRSRGLSTAETTWQQWAG